MARVKRGVTAHARHKKVLSQAKGFRGRSSTCFRPAIERLEKSWQYAYRDRRNKKRDLRALWIQRINAAVRELGSKYSVFMSKLSKSKVEIDRKILAKMAVETPSEFKKMAEGILAGKVTKSSNPGTPKEVPAEKSAAKSTTTKKTPAKASTVAKKPAAKKDA